MCWPTRRSPFAGVLALVGFSVPHFVAVHSVREIPAREITVHLFKAADLACHHQGPDLAFEVIALRLARLWELLICAALTYPLNLLFSYGVANPFRGVRLARAQEDFCRGLRHHRLRFVPITHF